MQQLKGKRIIIGVCGGIAAYKTLSLIRGLQKQGAEVRCVCTPAAFQFVTELSLQTLSRYPVYSDLFDRRNEFSTAHVSYADWADFLIVAPATADTLAKFAHGIADNALTTLFNAYSGPSLLVPAMNHRMYHHPATQANLQTLTQYGAHVMSPATGFQACGTEGDGRMPEPEEILAYFLEMTDRDACGSQGSRKVCHRSGSGENIPSLSRYWAGKHVLITAGPTREALDPVRYITNHSTGLMGCCLSDALTERGAKVHLVLGPTDIRPQREPEELIEVTTAQQMFEACIGRWPKMKAGILAAAVADYTPRTVSAKKIKKSDNDLQLQLVRTQDILKTLGQTKKKTQCLVGFALETDSELDNARKKLQSKNADFIVLNSLQTPGAGFKVATNQVCILDRKGGRKNYPLQSKRATADAILDHIEATKL